MRKKIYGIATALALAMGCGLFLTYPVQAAETQDVQQEESDYFTLPNGKKFHWNLPGASYHHTRLHAHHEHMNPSMDLVPYEP